MSYVCFHSFKIVVSKNFIFKNIFFKNHIRATSTCFEELKYKKNQPSLGESPNISLLDTTLSIPSLFHLDNEKSMKQVYFAHPTNSLS